MPDRIPELDRLAARAEEVPMLPPAEVRRRGDRRRTVRRGSVAGLAVLAVTALGIGVWLSPLLDGPSRPQWASPEPTPPVTASTSPTTQEPDPATTPPEASRPPTPAPATAVPPTWDNVPDAAIMFPHDPSLVSVTTDHEGMGQAAKGLCDPGQWGDATTILTREFEAVDGGTSTAIVIGYGSEEAAREGFDLIKNAAHACPTAEQAPMATFLDGPDPSGVYITSWHDNPDDDDSGLLNETFLAQSGTRVLWEVRSFAAQDHNCIVETGGPAVQCDWVSTSGIAIDRLAG